MQIAKVRRDYHVTTNGPFWQVTREGGQYAEYTTVTKAEAIGAAIGDARSARVSVIVHGKDGRIQNVWSYDQWNGPWDLWAGVNLLG